MKVFQGLDQVLRGIFLSFGASANTSAFAISSTVFFSFWINFQYTSTESVLLVSPIVKPLSKYQDQAGLSIDGDITCFSGF